jgi:hypothetical protein
MQVRVARLSPSFVRLLLRHHLQGEVGCGQTGAVEERSAAPAGEPDSISIWEGQTVTITKEEAAACTHPGLKHYDANGGRGRGG